jgi:hypothetical protein
VKHELALIGVASLMLSGTVCAQTSQPDPVTRARERAENSSPQDCAKACFESAHQLIESANQQYTAGNEDQGRKLIDDAVSAARRGTESSIKTHKNQKNAEIALRKMAKRMHDIGNSLSLDDRPPAYEAEKVLDKLRDEMLAAMFGTPKKSLGDKR